ncbi:hypothetical protein COB55_00065 [Candidatus Wolfebacteria bacterium]|nr:MAG: hypothetical protein COB55_00065 [Candidatus Wolfebacteria bacterium]
MKLLSTRLITLCIILGLLVSSSAFAQGAVDQREAKLRAELSQVEEEIAEQQVVLDVQKKESGSIQRDISILTSQINKAKLNIKSRNITIGNLGDGIKEKTSTIASLEDQVARGKESLAKIMRRTDEVSAFSLTEIMLSQDNLSDFFLDIDTFAIINNSLRTLFEEISDIKAATEVEREALDGKRKQAIDARVDIEAQKRVVERREDQKQDLLHVSKKKEAGYKEVIAERSKRAAEIRSTLFALRDSAAIPFGDALRFAEEASAGTGVRPAFILGILKQESNLGENVGTCNRLGDPASKGWREIMKPTRDHKPYLRIVNALGFNPDVMPLSCPWGNGWGGAMGPSQFIPSTWAIFEKQIARITGNSPANPWNPRDAITATALFLSDLGADEGGYSAENEAALRYYAGGNWWKDKNAFYGRGVMAKAQDIQENMIDPLKEFGQ